MKRLLDLHSKYRLDKLLLRKERQNEELRFTKLVAHLKMKLRDEVSAARQHHADVLHDIAEQARRDRHAAWLYAAASPIDEKERAAVGRIVDAGREEARERRAKAEEEHRETLRQIHTRYYRNLETLEQDHTTLLEDIDRRRAELTEAFQAEEQEALAEYRRKKAEEGGASC